MEDLDDSFVQVFIEESMEHLADMEQVLLAIEKDGAHIDEDRVNKVFRAAHTIKGSAGFMGYDHIETLAHKMEDVLGLIRKGHLVPNSENINQLLLSFDTLKKMSFNPTSSQDYDIAAHLEGLNSVVEGAKRLTVVETTAEPTSLADFVVEAPDSGVVLKATANDVSVASTAGKGTYLIRIEREAEPADGIIEKLKRYGTVLSVASFATQENQSILYILFACVLRSEDLRQLVNVDAGHIWIVGTDGKVQPVNDFDVPSPPEAASEPLDIIFLDDDAAFQDISFQPKDQPDTSPVSLMTATAEKQALSRESKLDSTIAPPSSIRVNLSLLDSLMNMAGELVLSRNQLLQAISMNDSMVTAAAAKNVDAITSELQETVMLTRMQPIGTLFNRFNRLVRDLARELGKEVALDMTGKSVELDRTLLENVSDPLTHLVRNAVDHGIEPVDERKRMGKGEVGSIKLRAFHQAGQINIEICDDGRGLDPERIASKGVEKGFLTQEQVILMTSKEKMNLIFCPGFTTKEAVSSVSGRGVGMDVVKTNINRLGGQIDVDSEPNMGTRIRIKLPLTMAIIPGQIISVEDQKFILPQTSIEELLRVPADQVKQRLEWVGSAQVIRLRNRLLPVVRLSDLLGIERTYGDPSSTGRKPDRRKNIADRRSKRNPLFGSRAEDSDEASTFENRRISRSRSDRRYRAESALNIVVLSNGLIKYGLIVDRFHDSEEIVVKPLGRHLKNARAFAGATILGNGDVALILDSGDIARIAEFTSLEGTDRSLEAAKKNDFSDHQEDALNLLTFRNAEDERFAIPLSQVLRIEKIEAAAIQTYGRRKSIQYRGGNLLVFSLDEIAHVSPLANKRDFLVIVSSAAGRQVGILAVGPVDSVATFSKVDDASLKQPGIMGSVLINNQTSLVVDLHDMIQHLYSEKAPKPSKEPLAGTVDVAKGTLLVVEDSTFFRKQIKTFLENKGFTVLEAEDGTAGWEALHLHKQEIDLVITDIEMPMMNGLEFSRKIRAEETFANVPIIALTTLADEENEEEGKRSGIDDYQIKLDKQELLASIETLIQRHGKSQTSPL